MIGEAGVMSNIVVNSHTITKALRRCFKVCLKMRHSIVQWSLIWGEQALLNEVIRKMERSCML